jgi:hypothetical protein
VCQPQYIAVQKSTNFLVLSISKGIIVCLCWFPDHVHNWRATMAGLSLILSLSILIYGIGTHYAKNAPDYRVFEDPDKTQQKATTKGRTATADLPYATNRDV